MPENSDRSYFANPATLALKPIPAGPFSRLDPGFVWAGVAVITISTVTAPDVGPGRIIEPGDSALFDPLTRHWTRLPALPGHPLLSASPVWTGSELLTLTTAGNLFVLHSNQEADRPQPRVACRAWLSLASPLLSSTALIQALSRPSTA